jgi:uncharacterized protein
MTLDEIRHQLGTARGIPNAALAAAIEQAEALVPEVTELIDLACKGVVLTLPQEKLLLYGVHALAAARRTELYVPLLALIEWRPDDLELLLSKSDLAALLLSTCGPEEEAPFDLLENPNIPGHVKASLFLLIARMVWEGRAPRAEFIALLDSFEREAAIERDDPAWFGWQSAIALLGLTNFEDRVRAGWRTGRLGSDMPQEQEEWIKELNHSARDPEDGHLFVEYGVEPIDDVLDALGWMRLFGLDKPADEDEADPDDPARDIRLTQEERDWLDYFLMDEIIPPGAMDLENIDGFLTALAAGPMDVPREEWWLRIWSELATEEPDFETQEQGDYVRALIDRHWETVGRRLKAGYRHKPWLDEQGEPESSENWAIGFIVGMDMRPGSWDRIHRHKQGSLAVASTLLLLPPEYLAEADEEQDEELEPLDEESRAPIIANLPDLVRMAYAFWHDQPVLPLFEPRRVQKIGRNEPCLCGSGRKYKKCCGVNAAS